MVSFLFLYDIRFGQKMDLKILHPGFLEVFGRYQSYSSTDFSAFWYISSLDIRVQHIERFFGNVKKCQCYSNFSKKFEFLKILVSKTQNFENPR